MAARRAGKLADQRRGQGEGHEAECHAASQHSARSTEGAMANQMRALAREIRQFGVQPIKEIGAHQLASRALRRANPRLTRLRMTISEQPSDRAISP